MLYSELKAALKNPRLTVMLPLGFSSGLPLALTGGTLQAWLAVLSVDIRTIGLFSLVGIPYTLKFLWSPLMDRFCPVPPGRRRGWIILCQLFVSLGIIFLALINPARLPMIAGMIALWVAFSSASQDIVIDAYRTDVLKEPERGLGVGLSVTGYRIAMLVSGALALILADRLGWKITYILMAVLMLACICAPILGPEPETKVKGPSSLKEAVIEPMGQFFSRKGAMVFLFLIILYKLGDAFAGTLTTAFLIRGVGFTPSDVGTVNKGLGLFATVFGALFGGGLMTRLGLYRSLMAFGVLQAISNLAFMLLALVGKSYLMMILAVLIENISGGMGTSAFVALLMALCDQRYSATQYALLSALAALGRVFVGPPSGFLVAQVGWPWFFFLTTLFAMPGLLVLKIMKKSIFMLHDT